MSLPSNSESAAAAATECTIPDCRCPFHREDLPPPQERWYCVIVGREPGVYQGHARASELTHQVSGAAYYFFAAEQEARTEFQRALQAGEVVKVSPSIRNVLTRDDLANIPGFRYGDPLGPESGDWAVVIVGRTPGIFLSSAGAPSLRGNLAFVKHAHVLYSKSRSAAVHEFCMKLDSGSVVQVVKGEERVLLDGSSL